MEQRRPCRLATAKMAPSSGGCVPVFRGSPACQDSLQASAGPALPPVAPTARARQTNAGGVVEAWPARNPLAQVEVIPAAVWNHSGYRTFQLSATESRAASSRRGAVVGANGEVPGPNQIKVETVSLDDFSRDKRLPTVIKIDVEGAEAEVLQGARNIIAQAAPVLIVEVHCQSAAAFLENQLPQDDYRIEWHERHPKFPFPRYLVARPRD